MQIALSKIGFDEFSTEIFHIHRLFFEEANIGAETSAETELLVTLRLEEDEQQARGYAVLSLPGGSGSWQADSTRVFGAAADCKAIRRRAVLSALLQALQMMTELEQPWGILTGVRPTKLMHNLLQKHSAEECRHILEEQYLVSETKARLLVDIAERQLRVIPDLFRLDREISLYIGIPFCPTKCAYCTFPAYDIRGNNGSVNGFLAGLHDELRQTGAWLKEAGLKMTTIYWGGGTPTSITAEEMDALFATMHAALPDMESVRELTVEAGRPDTITPDKIRVMLKWNVDRISINPQSFTQETLDAIGRHHTVKETVEKFLLSREMGMDNINMDLIIGLPNEGMAELERSLAETGKLMPESLTVHTLSFKRASRMTQNREQYEVAERDEIAEMMERAIQWTEERGYVPYYLYRQKNILGNLENVGYALEGRESLYNILMMEERQTIIGVGCGAVSKIVFPREAGAADGAPQRIERFANPKEPNAYNQAYQDYIDKKRELLNEAYAPFARQVE